MAVLLGKRWPYITPEYMYYEMDTQDINRYIGLMGNDDLAKVFRPKSYGLKQGIEDGVISGARK